MECSFEYVRKDQKGSQGLRLRITEASAKKLEDFMERHANNPDAWISVKEEPSSTTELEKTHYFFLKDLRSFVLRKVDDAR